MQRLTKGAAAAMRRMADVRRRKRPLRDSADREHATTARELSCKGQAGFDFAARRRAVRDGRARVGRHDVPEQDVCLEIELLERAMDDRRRRLRGSGAGDLALRRERDPADARAAIARGLADEENRRVVPTREVRREPRT
jgi:hypothetical protein